MYQQIESAPFGHKWKEEAEAIKAAMAQKSQGAILGGQMPERDVSEVEQQLRRLSVAIERLDVTISEVWNRLQFVTRGPVEANTAGMSQPVPSMPESPLGREIQAQASRIEDHTSSLHSLMHALRV